MCSPSIDNVLGLLDLTIREYNDLLSDSCVDLDKEGRFKYESFVECLELFRERVSVSMSCNEDNIVMDILASNYGFYDTLFRSVDGVEFTVGKDDIVTVKNGFVVLFDDLDGDVLVNRAFDLDCVEEIITLEE